MGACIERTDGGRTGSTRASIPRRPKRRQIGRQGFATKRSAEEALAEALGAVAHGTVVSRSTVPLGEYLAEWFVTARPSLRPTTARGYAQAIRRLDKHLGPYQLQSLTPMQVQRCYTDLLEKGGRLGGPLAPKTVRHAHVVLRKALSDAERMGLVSRNAAAAGARAPAGEHTEMSTWGSDDLRDFLAAIEGQPYEIGFRLLAATGLRRGEVLGLCWRDVGLDLGQLSVSNTITEIGAEVVMGPPKTARSRRNVYLDRRTVAALREHRQRQRELRLAAGPAWDSDHDWVLTDELGGFVRPQWMSYAWRVLMNQSDLPRIRLHDLRHTHATLALKAGVHPKVVSERLGHATVGITLDLYSHVVPSLSRDAAEQIMSATYGEDWGGAAMKQSARRGDPPLPSATVLIRGDLLDPDVLAESARRNFEVYGFYGISVFAETAEVPWTELAATRFAAAEWLVLFNAGQLTSSGLDLWDTGMAPHFDLVHHGLTELVARMLATPHRVIQNPHHGRGGDH